MVALRVFVLVTRRALARVVVRRLEAGRVVVVRLAVERLLVARFVLGLALKRFVARLALARLADGRLLAFRLAEARLAAGRGFEAFLRLVVERVAPPQEVVADRLALVRRLLRLAVVVLVEERRLAPCLLAWVLFLRPLTDLRRDVFEKFGIVLNS